MIPKFRAWDSEANIMIYSDHRTRKLYDVYYGFEMNEKGELECRWEGDFTESQVLDGGILDNIMQYTGLKDKNGRQIFEGDILKCRRYEFVKVIWGDDGFKAWYQPSSVNITVISLNHFLKKNKSTKIIGNIYENPELLEV